MTEIQQLLCFYIIRNGHNSMWPAGQQRWFCPSAPLWWDSTWSSASSSGPLSTGKTWTCWNHRIIGWKRPLRSSSPTVNRTPPCLLKHIPKCHIYTFFEHLKGWGLHHFLGQPISMPDHSFSKEIFLTIQSKPPLMQLEAIASRPFTN